MSAPDFDPYHEWLGIPPDEQPANHYRLLGLELYETDRKVIESVSLKQISHVRTFALGENSETSQSLLNELSAARVTLLNAVQKADYDQQLRQRLNILPRPLEAFSETRQQTATAPKVNVTQHYGNAKRTKTDRPTSAPHNKQKFYISAAAGLALALVILACSLLFLRAHRLETAVSKALNQGDYQAALELDPANERALSMRRTAESVRFALNRRDYREVLRLDPTNSQGLELKKSADIRRALEVGDYARALKIDPANAEALAMKKANGTPPAATGPFDAAKAKEHQEAWARHLGVEVETANSIAMQFRVIPPGTVPKHSLDDAPLITLAKPVFFSTYEVTQGQYEQVMGVKPTNFRAENNPVMLKGDAALMFCRKLSELPEEKAAGRVYFLPSESNWEYTCRAGTTTTYSFGNDKSQLGEYAWSEANSGEKPHPVGGKKPNAWGLFDMHGNVCEWCHESNQDDSTAPAMDAMGATSGSDLVVRGANWRMSPVLCHSRARVKGSDRLVSGFRVCMTLSGKRVNRNSDTEDPLREKDMAGGTQQMQQGLLYLQYERRNTQKGNNGFIDLHQFNSPTAMPTVTSGDKFSYPASANAVFFGYLKIDRPGTYTFRAYNFYDRSAIFVNGVRVSGYRGSVSNGTDSGNPQKSQEKIQLPSGYIPFAVIGYVDARGAVNDVQWAQPEDASFSKIPAARFFYTDQLRQESAKANFRFEY